MLKGDSKTMRLPGRLRPLLTATVLATLALASAPVALAAVADGASLMPQESRPDPGAALADPKQVVAPILNPGEGAPGAPIPGPGEGGADDGAGPGFAENVRRSFSDQFVFAGLATVAVVGIGLLGVSLVTRYVDPKEALQNPQRAMLYGFVRGNPGVHLKRLSEEFHMKTSSILWHMRKLECAELVRSERSNGFRVFHPTAGGVEVRNVGRAVTALQNRNAHQIFLALTTKPGAASGQLADGLGMHAGTARWHLKKLKEFGLVEEVPGPEGARYLPTPLGQKAFNSMSSAGVTSPAAPPAPTVPA